MRLRKVLSIAYSRLRRRIFSIPLPGTVGFGDLRRVEPISRDFGTDRGQPIDRHYIESFLERHGTDIRGRVLEVGEDLYTRRFGGSRVTQSDVLHVREGNPRATIIADLADAPQLADDTFDSIVLTQTLHLVYDARAAVRTIFRILKPGGVLLLTVPGLTPVPTRTQWGYTWHWAFTALSVERMLSETFGPDNISVGTTGNVLVANAFLHGLATEELAREELDFTDPDYPVILTARARKSEPSS
jgi:SAM-dependent methyltransferase